MRISHIREHVLPTYSLENSKTKKEEKNKNNINQTNILNGTIPYQVAFLGRDTSLSDRLTMRNLRGHFSPEAEDIYQKAEKIASQTGSSKIETTHLYLASLVEFKKYLKELDEGVETYNPDQRFKFPISIEAEISLNYKWLADKKAREKLTKVINAHISKIKASLLAKQNGKKPHTKPYPSKDTIEDLCEAYKMAKAEGETGGFIDSYFYTASCYSKNKKLVAETYDLVFDMQKAVMVDDENKQRANHLKFYDDKADTIWKNISLGNDTIFICDSNNSEAKKHLISSFVNLLQKPGQKYKNIDPKNTEVVVLNNNATLDFLEKLTDKPRYGEKDKTTVIVGDLGRLLYLSNNVLTLEHIELLNNRNKNNKTRFVFSMIPESYYNNTENGTVLQSALSSYAVQTIPTLNMADAMRYLTDENGLNFVKSELGKEIAPEVIRKAIEITSNDGGNYPDKALAIISQTGKYFVDKKELKPKDLEQYAAETRCLSETQNKSEQGNIIFDTGKTLSDIVGSPMTKADAASIVSQIKSGRIGTKGFRAFLEDGSSYGGGRRHTAEAIAGEAGIPMIVINAKDFALKDIDAISSKASLSEMKIKKIISAAKAQAETNKNKAAMIFIENFDNFAANPLYGISSVYEQKAFSQLLEEMETTRKEDNVNLIIVGSVNIPEIIDPNIMKPYKFLNSIVIYPPQDSKERQEVITHYLNKMKLDVEGENEEEKTKTIKDIADTTTGFTVVDLMYLLETARNVSEERGKTKIDSSDFIEAYLQTISGRPNEAHIDESKKRITASHEAGHALTLQIMYELAEKQNIKWHLPEKVNFITLDPRGQFGGAMFMKSSDNQEYNFETMMSDLICSFGGHSAEDKIYNIKGSWGITADMQNVAGVARSAVLNMGMGPKTGVCAIPRNSSGFLDLSDKKKQDIEADVDAFVNAAREISNRIVEAYKPFILQFTDRYCEKVGTGKCIIPSEQFLKELNEWRNGLSNEEKEKLKDLEIQILEILEKAKKGTFDV